MAGATIRIYLISGTPLGPRTAEKSNWTGRAIDFARVNWSDVKGRPEFERPGVYVLSGEDDGLRRVYIGEADDLGQRIHQHHAGPYAKGFWTRATVFTSRDDSFNKAHVKHIEARLIGMAKDAKRVHLENGNSPGEPSLSEADRAEAETFLSEMLVIYPLLNIDAFVKPVVKLATSPPLTLKGRGMTAHGTETPEGFVVLAGSTAAVDAVPSAHAYLRSLRQALVDQGLLVPSDGLLRLVQDYTFASPSTAAGVMLGRTSNGRVDWKDAMGRPLKDVQGELSPE